MQPQRPCAGLWWLETPGNALRVAVHSTVQQVSFEFSGLVHNISGLRHFGTLGQKMMLWRLCGSGWRPGEATGSHKRVGEAEGCSPAKTGAGLMVD
jgi:hypothetical protein